jgi:hypothetical protein
MRTEPEPNQTTIEYRSTPEYKDGNRENQRARETAVPFRLMWPDTRISDWITSSAPFGRVDLAMVNRPRLGGKEPSDAYYRL